MTALLLAIVTCEARKEWANAQRDTWVKDCRHDVRFFLARQPRDPLADEVFVDSGDGYEALAAKVREVSRYAHAAGYQTLLKLDDDTICWPTRLVLPQAHYVGWKQEPESGNWCSGMAYWLSRDCMKVISEAELPATSVAVPAPEDRWTGGELKKAGIVAQRAPQGSIQWIGQRRHFGGRPLPANLRAQLSRAYAAGEFMPHEFVQAYRY
jgi:hypothetical protein